MILILFAGYLKNAEVSVDGLSIWYVHFSYQSCLNYLISSKNKHRNNNNDEIVSNRVQNIYDVCKFSILTAYLLSIPSMTV